MPLEPSLGAPDLDLDLRVRKGSFRLEVRLRVDRGPLALVGPNGAGKTTLLLALAGQRLDVEGSARVRGRDVTLLPPEERRVGYVPLGGGVFPHLTAAENVAYGLSELDSKVRHRRIDDLLAMVGATGVSGRRAGTLSGGERQRVALARALARAPEILLLDEPTASIDVPSRAEIRELLARHLRSPARCGVVVTHDARDLLAWDPVVVLLEGGRIVEQGRVEDLKGSRHPFLRELLGQT